MGQHARARRRHGRRRGRRHDAGDGLRRHARPRHGRPLLICDVPVGHIEALWPHVRGHIERPLDREGSGRYEPADVLALLLLGKAKLWVEWNAERKTADAAIVTELIDYPRLRELRIWLVGGVNMKSWVYGARDTLENYARAQGCAYIVGALRKGWIRIGGDGWRETGVTFEKAL